MKQILRLFAVVGVVLLAALISAGSCDNDGDGNKNTNTNNNSGNSGGDGNGNTGGDGTGGDGNTGGNTASPVKITFPDANFAKRSGVADIVLKASGFPATTASTANAGMNTVNTAPVGTRKTAFSLEFEGATGGLTIVDKYTAFDMTGTLTTTLPAVLLWLLLIETVLE